MKEGVYWTATNDRTGSQIFDPSATIDVELLSQCHSGHRISLILGLNTLEQRNQENRSQA
jgi:hypothetical protein